MKTKLYFPILVAILVAFVVGCSSKLETFGDDPNGYYGPIGEVEYVEGESLPGKIKLTWSVPDDSSYQYLQVKYFDHMTQREKHHVLSVYANELIVDNTAKRFGDYTFHFQTFNAKHQGGNVVTVVAQSGTAPKEDRLVATKVALTKEQLSSNSVHSDGKIEYLIDNDITTYFHTKPGTSDADKKAPHYLQIKLEEPLSKFQLVAQNSPSKIKTFAKKVEILASQTGANNTWTTLETLAGSIPSGANQYFTEVYTLDKPTNYIRWNVQSSNAGNGVAWSLGLLELYRVETVVFDPEAE